MQSHRTRIRFQKMLRYIRAHVLEEIPLKQLTDSAGIGRSEAGRCFKKYCVRSPMSCLTLYRLMHDAKRRAKSLLSVHEAAAQCGFKDSSCFIKMFRIYFGQTGDDGNSQVFEQRLIINAT